VKVVAEGHGEVVEEKKGRKAKEEIEGREGGKVNRDR
jgi:hypothetical protein